MPVLAAFFGITIRVYFEDHAPHTSTWRMPSTWRWSRSTIKRVLAVDAEKFRVELEYTDRFRGTVELGFLFGSPKGKRLVAEILRGDLFGKCFVESGALAWPNGYELCPDSVRGWIAKQKNDAA